MSASSPPGALPPHGSPSPTPPTRPASTPRIPELDGIRGLAILLVLVWHYGASRIRLPADSPWQTLHAAFGLAWSGVDLFFVLSGFLIGGILLDQRHSPNYFKVFYIRRTCRIFPLYYLLVLGCYLAMGAGLNNGSPIARWLFEPALSPWTCLTYTQNFEMLHRGTLGGNWLGVTWSLAIEEQFYLLLPLCLRWVPPSRVPLLLLAGILLGPASRTAFYLYHPNTVAGGYVMMPCRADALLLGALAAWLIRQPAWHARLKQRYPLLLASLALLGIAPVFFLSTDPHWLSPAMTLWGRSALALFYAVFLLLPLLHPTGWIARLCRLPGLAWLGLVSYSVYLIHQVVLGAVYALAGQSQIRITAAVDVWYTVAALLLTLVLAALLHAWIERPLQNLGHRFKY